MILSYTVRSSTRSSRTGAYGPASALITAAALHAKEDSLYALGVRYNERSAVRPASLSWSAFLDSLLAILNLAPMLLPLGAL